MTSDRIPTDHHPQAIDPAEAASPGISDPQGPWGLRPEKPPPFSLTAGGPLYQLFLRWRLARHPLELQTRRIVSLLLIAWAPLLALSLAANEAWGKVEVPFLFDLDVQARLLVAMPLLVAAERMTHSRLSTALKQFHARGLLAPPDLAPFQANIALITRLRDSITIEVSLLLFSFTAGYWIWKDGFVLRRSAWYAEDGAAAFSLTPAGCWLAFVSLPIVRFLILRWYFRILLWHVFLWRTSRIRLRLNALHPDRAGGLGFLGGTIFAFGMVLIAHAAMLSGMIGNRIWHERATLPQFKMDIAALMAFLLAIAVAPQYFFARQLARARRNGAREYGAVASHYVNAFYAKWIKPAEAGGEPILGTGDIQSLADLANSFSVTREMRLAPMSQRDLFRLAIIVALPLAPLLLTIIPLDEILDRAIKVVF